MLFSGRKHHSSAKVLEQHADTVENILASLNVNLDEARLSTEQGFGWSFRRGTAIIEVYISEHEGDGYLQVLAPIIVIPENGLLPLYRRLLELNLQLTNASLGIYLDVVYVFSERPLQGLESVEADAIIKMVAEYADDLDNNLVSEFGGRLYSQV